MATIFYISLFGLVLAIILEKYISNKWLRSYYCFGIPLFIRRMDGSKKIKEVTNSEYSIRKYNQEMFFFRFGNHKKLGPQFYELSTIHGYVKSEKDKNKFVSIFYINWDLFFLLVLFLSSIKFINELWQYLLIVLIVSYLFYRIIKSIMHLQNIFSNN